MRFVALILLVSCSSSFVSFDGSVFFVEVADSPDEHSKGLMFRESMPSNHGMLFVFDDVAVRNFWMKNTLIPLDMIFVDDSFVVVEIKKDVQPCKKDPCESYASLPAKYVVEVNAGASDGIELGSVMKLSK